MWMHLASRWPQLSQGSLCCDVAGLRPKPDPSCGWHYPVAPARARSLNAELSTPDPFPLPRLDATPPLPRSIGLPMGSLSWTQVCPSLRS